MDTPVTVEVVSVESFSLDKPFDYTTTDLALEQKLIFLIEKYGQIVPVHAFKDENGRYIVLAGKRILKACKALGYKVIYTMVLKDLTAKDKLVISLALNELQFKPNYIELGREIFNILTHEDIKQLKNVLPYDLDTMDKLEQITKFNWDSLNPDTGIAGQTKLL